MNILKSAIFFLAISVMALPSLSNVQAYDHHITNEAAFTFPTPAIKPNHKTGGGINDKDVYYDEKQAMVAALGLYLGVKQATPPHH